METTKLKAANRKAKAELHLLILVCRHEGDRQTLPATGIPFVTKHQLMTDTLESTLPWCRSVPHDQHDGGRNHLPSASLKETKNILNGRD